MQKIDNLYIIPTDVLCLVAEVKDGKLLPITGSISIGPEEVFNECRQNMLLTSGKLEDKLDMIDKRYRRYLANIEFMTPLEREISEMEWKEFDVEAYKREAGNSLQNLRKAIYELTDLMLEYNIPLKSSGSENGSGSVGVKQINIEDVKNLLDGLGKKD